MKRNYTLFLLMNKNSILPHPPIWKLTEKNQRNKNDKIVELWNCGPREWITSKQFKANEKIK